MQSRAAFAALTLSLAGAMAVFAQAPPSYNIQSIAGALKPGDGGPAANSFIQFPGVLAVDPSGVVYIGQTFGAIRRVGTDGTITTIAGLPNVILYGAGVPASTGDGGPAVSAGISDITGMALDAANNLYVSDTLGCRIRRINLQTGVIDNYAGTAGTCRAGADGPVGTATFNIPRSLLIDSQGRLLVVDGNRLRRIDLSTGTVTTVAGNGTAGLTGNGGAATQAQIATPGGLTQDSAGNLYFTDPGNCLVREIVALTGILQTIAGTTCGYSGDNAQASAAQLDNPGALVVDAGHSRLYVAESGTGSRIRMIDLSSRVISTYAGTGQVGLAGDGGLATAAQFAQPAGLALDKTGALLVSESSNRVRRIDSSGMVTTFAGGPTFGGDGGQASSALLYLSRGGLIASDHKGGYVVVDQANGRIRAVSANGVIRTVAGINQFTPASGDGGPALNAGFATVRGVAVDAAGNIYFVQGAGLSDPRGELRRITPTGTIDRFGSASYLGPLCVGVDVVKNLLYVCEGSGNRLDRVDISSGSVSVFAGSGSPGAPTGGYGFAGDGGPANQALLFNPIGVSVDGQGNVYVFDQGNARIRKITASGSNILTVAGNGATVPGSGGLTFSAGDGGKAIAASIYTYAGVAADAAGNVFIGEGNRIRRVDASSGIINTIAGTGKFGLTEDAGPAASAQTAIIALDIDANGNLLTVDGDRVVLITNPTAAAIITVDVLGGFTDLAQNAWIVIKGVNLAPPNLSASQSTWSTAPDFAAGKMPTQLANVSVTVNGKAAFIYYVSPTQVNALTPLDNALGPVQVVVTNGAVSSAPATMNLRAAAPSLFLVGATNYVLATHTDFSLAGPASLSAPGFPFTPARPGETIVLYITGLGLPSTTLVNGSALQSGALPSLPVVQFGTAPATVSFAGVVGPGTYQLNVVVPGGAATGDNPLSVSYGGATTPAGALIAVQP